MNKSILSGIRVIDLTDIKGRLCSRLLADMGAEVILMEKPGNQVIRDFTDAGKHSISLNIETKKGQGLFKRLLQTADILIESFPPGFLCSLGLGYSDLQTENPGLIVVSITDFGQTGPYRNLKSSPLVASATGGQMYVCGKPGEPPLKPYGAQAYLISSLFAVNGVMLAIGQRQTSQKGQIIDVSIQECVASTLDSVLVSYFSDGAVAERSGGLYRNGAFRVFRCLDGWVLISLFNGWETLVELLDSEGMAGDLKDKVWSEETHRRKHLSQVIESLEKWTLKHTADELVESGQSMHFPWAKVASIAEVMNNPQLNARGFFAEIVDPDSGCYKIPGAPFQMSRSPVTVGESFPKTGDYNRKIFIDEIGLTEQELSGLSQEGVI